MKNIKEKAMSINIFGGKKTPRSVNDIVSTFTDVVHELEDRIAFDEETIAESKAEIERQNIKIAASEGSRCQAISIKSRINDLLGIK